jgi:hypothetical protein
MAESICPETAEGVVPAGMPPMPPATPPDTVAGLAALDLWVLVQGPLL